MDASMFPTNASGRERAQADSAVLGFNPRRLVV
jgi:hypothetical protein